MIGCRFGRHNRGAQSRACVALSACPGFLLRSCLLHERLADDPPRGPRTNCISVVSQLTASNSNTIQWESKSRAKGRTNACAQGISEALASTRVMLRTFATNAPGGVALHMNHDDVFKRSRLIHNCRTACVSDVHVILTDADSDTLNSRSRSDKGYAGNPRQRGSGVTGDVEDALQVVESVLILSTLSVGPSSPELVPLFNVPVTST